MRTCAVLTLLTLTLACGQDPQTSGGLVSEARDSAGILIVENARPPDASRLGWRIGPEPDVSIGVLEGEEPYMLHWVGGATRLPDGRIVVANGGTQEVRVFDRTMDGISRPGGEKEGAPESSRVCLGSAGGRAIPLLPGMRAISGFPSSTPKGFSHARFFCRANRVYIGFDLGLRLCDRTASSCRAGSWKKTGA